MKLFLVGISSMIAVWCACGDELASPDGAIKASVAVEEGRIWYTLTYQGKPVVDKSEVGLDFEKPVVTNGFKIKRREQGENHSQWKQIWGERAIVPDAYRKLILESDLYDVEFRVYNEGFAVRYYIRQPWQLRAEKTSFTLPAGSAAFAIAGTEDTFPQQPLPYDKIPKTSMTPFTVALADGRYFAMVEAFVVSYPRCRVAKLGDQRIGVTLMGKAQGERAFHTPWRAWIVGKNEAQLIEHAYLSLNLNPPPTQETSWIQPGLTISDHYNCMLTMPDLKRVIDVAWTNGFKYLQLDWGWYGTEWPWTDKEREQFLKTNPSWSNETTWVANTYADPFKVAKGKVPYRPDWKDFHTVVDLDMPELVRYAKAHNMGICLYMHGNVLAAHDLDKLFAAYQEWGLAGLKPGFVRYGQAADTDWLRHLAETAMKHHLWLGIHDAHVPDGMERTYPNLFTTEGGGGQEGNHPVHQDVVMPFTRCLVGPFDYTPHIYSQKKSHAHGVAFFVVFPGATTIVRGGMKEFLSQGPNRIGDEAEFFRSVPTSWDETRVLDAKVGHHIVTARRKGRDWYIGGMTAQEAYETALPLDFLRRGVAYEAVIFKDSPTLVDGWRPAIKEVQRVNADQALKIRMEVSGGIAMIVREYRKK